MSETRKQGERLGNIEKALEEIEKQLRNPTQVLEATKKVENAVKELKKQLKEVQESFKTIADRQEIQDKEMAVIKADNLKMKKDMQEFRDIIEGQEREKRKCWLELTGIQVRQKDKPTDILQKIHEACALDIQPQEIKDVYVKSQKNQKTQIIVKYDKMDTKVNVQKAIRVKRLKTSGLGFQDGNRDIFANDCLSYYASSLFWQVRQEKFKNKWRSAWTLGGKIYVRMESEGEAILIKTVEDLLTLTK